MNKKGFTLIELIVTVAVLAILASVFVMSNLNAMEKQRKEADVVAMEQIDGYLKEILLNEDVFDEITEKQETILEAPTGETNKSILTLNFKVAKSGDDSYLFIDKFGKTASMIKKAQSLSLYDSCPTLYRYLVEYFDGDDANPGKIKLTSANYREGLYVVTIEFNTAKISENRPAAISNDSVTITNSGGDLIYRKQ